MLAYLRQPETPELPRQQTLPLLRKLRRPESGALLPFGIGTSRGSRVGCHSGPAHILFVTGSVALCLWSVKAVVMRSPLWAINALRDAVGIL